MTIKQEILAIEKQTEQIRQINKEIKEIFRELGELC